MIWNVAEALIRNGIMMANNANQLQLQPAVLEMVHRDLKAGNVFLDANHPTVYPGYPLPCVADFGHAFLTSQPDERNPYWWSGSCGTVGWTPPELTPFVNPITLQSVNGFQIREKTNVWQVGAILRSLVLLQRQPPMNMWLNGVADEALYRVQGTPGYTMELLQMIDEMMQYDPANRPTFAVLAARIAAHTWDRSLGMRTGAPMMPGLQINVPQDIYNVGLAPPP